MAAPMQYADWVTESNPWWDDPGAINSDEHMRAWDTSKARYVPPIFYDLRSHLDAEGRVLYAVHGSRQVGKTTLVKLLMRDLLDRGTRPGNICYLSLNPHIAAADLMQAVRDYAKLTRTDRGDGRLYIFIDEVSMIREWQNTILSLSNMASLSNSALVVTGSSAIDLAHGTDGIVGKKGFVPGGSHRSLLPMGFLDYACIENPPLRKFLDANSAFTPESRSAIWKSLVSGKADTALNSLIIKSGDLDAVLHKYVISGGIPQVASQYFGTGRISDRYYTEYLGGIKYEWERMGYGAAHLERCMEFLIRGTGGTIAWNGMAKKIDVSNSTVAENYTMAIRDMYLALVTYLYDERHDTAAPKKLKKIHLRDPFFFHAFNTWSLNEGYFMRAMRHVSDDANFGRLVECVMADHLARHAISMSTDKSRASVAARLFHWRDRKGREVDFVYRDPGSVPVPVEAKYSGRVNRKGLGGLSGFLDATAARRGIVATRREHGVERDYTMVPAPVLLLLLS